MDVTRPDARRWDDEPAPRPRRRRWRWAAFFLLLLVVALSAGYLTWSKKAETRLNELMAELRRNGEPAEAKDLVHSPIPVEDDAAADLFAAITLLDKQGDPLEAFGKMELDGPISAKNLATIEKLVESERDVLDKVRGARGKRDADWRIPYQSPLLSTLLPHLNDVRTLANLSRAAAIRERARGNHAAALEHLRDALTIGEACDTHPFMVGHLVAIGVRAVATHTLGEMAPDLAIQAGGAAPSASAATPEQIRGAIRELLDESRSEAGFRGGMQGERVMQIETARLLADRKLDLNAVSGAGPGRRGFGAPPLPRGMILNDGHLMATQAGDLLKAYDKSPDYQSYKKNAPPALPPAMAKNRYLHIVASILMPAYDRYVLQQFRSRTDRRLVATALALRLYAADNGGKYPRTLDELVPKYLPAVPKDPFAAGDKPLNYSTDDPAAPAVYSVGEDGVDNKASQAPTRTRQGTPGRWETLDAVLEMKPKRLMKTEAEEKEDKEDEE